MTGRGRLVLVGTPIGNLGDLSPRAAEALRSADLLACEDTRRTGRLLELSGIPAPRMVVVNEHTEREETARILRDLEGGKTVVLVTDAGMPAVSDPGEQLVAAAVRAGHEVGVVPGPSAGVTALAMSGLPGGRFVFEGFLPRKGLERSARLAEVAAERRTTVLYEAPHRIERTVADLVACCGADRRVVVVRELTKLHEEIWRGSLAGAVDWLETHPPRGELVIVLEGSAAPPPASDEMVQNALREALAGGSTTRDAVAAVAADLGVARKRVYELALATQATPPT